jgi:hypothetical protein
MALAILLACAASGGPSALAITAGAVGAFGSGVLEVTSATLSGACLIGFAFVERTIRVRTPMAKAAHFTMAVLAGALAGALSSAYGAASVALRAVAALVAAVLVALPLLVDADDPVAHALEKLALCLRNPVARSLREGAHLRRHVEGASVHRDTRRCVARTWRSLLRLADVRVRLDRMEGVRIAAAAVDATKPRQTLSAADAVVNMLDRKIADHVAALARAYTAVDTAHAAELGLDDADTCTVDATSEGLEEMSRAIVEVTG